MPDSAYSFVADDDASTYRLTCRDNDTNAVLDLTNSTVELRWTDADGNVQTRNMTIENAAGGIVSYQFLEGELFAGVMGFEVAVLDAAGDELTSLDVLLERVRNPIG